MSARSAAYSHGAEKNQNDAGREIGPGRAETRPKPMESEKKGVSHGAARWCVFRDAAGGGCRRPSRSYGSEGVLQLQIAREAGEAIESRAASEQFVGFCAAIGEGSSKDSARTGKAKAVESSGGKTRRATRTAGKRERNPEIANAQTARHERAAERRGSSALKLERRQRMRRCAPARIGDHTGGSKHMGGELRVPVKREPVYFTIL